MPKLALLLLLLSSFGICQNQDFSEIDKRVKTIKYRGSLVSLVDEITNEYDNDILKTRAIYSWIIENIAYDYKTYNKGIRVKTFKCKSKNECEIKYNKFEQKIVNRVLNRKKAICSGYSLLFKKMCDLAQIQCVSVDGYIKYKPQHIGRMGKFDHAWNAVVIENKAYLLDLTWAAGYCTKNKKGKLNKFIKNRNDFYWFTPIDKFSLDHYPKKSEKILGFNVSKETFKNQPYIESNSIPIIDLSEPMKKGFLEVKKGDTIKFSFDYKKRFQNIQINTNLKRNPKLYKKNKKGDYVYQPRMEDRQEYVNFIRRNYHYEFDYVVTDENLKYIEILFDYNLILKYRIRFPKTQNSKLTTMN